MKIESKKLLKINNISHGFFQTEGEYLKEFTNHSIVVWARKIIVRNILHNLEIVKKNLK